MRRVEYMDSIDGGDYVNRKSRFILLDGLKNEWSYKLKEIRRNNYIGVIR